MGVSQMQVSRLLRRSLDRLRVVAEASEVAEVAVAA
jgi:DNA-directed RNA polymerase specialized sigma subunit